MGEEGDTALALIFGFSLICAAAAIVWFVKQIFGPGFYFISNETIKQSIAAWNQGSYIISVRYGSIGFTAYIIYFLAIIATPLIVLRVISSTFLKTPTRGIIDPEKVNTEVYQPFISTCLGVLIFWSTFVVPPVVAPVFAYTGIASFPTVQRWRNSLTFEIPNAVEYLIAVVYLLVVPVALGAVGWFAYQNSPSIMVGGSITIYILGLMGVVAIIVYYSDRAIQSLA